MCDNATLDGNASAVYVFCIGRQVSLDVVQWGSLWKFDYATGAIEVALGPGLPDAPSGGIENYTSFGYLPLGADYSDGGPMTNGYVNCDLDFDPTNGVLAVLNNLINAGQGVYNTIFLYDANLNFLTALQPPSSAQADAGLGWSGGGQRGDARPGA